MDFISFSSTHIPIDHMTDHPDPYKRYYFIGIVFPERAPLSVSSIENTLTHSDGSIIRINFDISLNQITAVVDIFREIDDDIYTLRNIVRDFIGTVTDVMGFLLGYAYDIEIRKVFNKELSLSKVFGINLPILEHRNKNRDPRPIANSIYQLCLEDSFFRRALTDLNLAIKHPFDTPFYCYRALESIRQYFGQASGKTDDKQQWIEMAKAIGDYNNRLIPIRELAFPARHGNHIDISDQMRKDTFLVTWEIMEKYVDFRLAQLGIEQRIFIDAGK